MYNTPNKNSINKKHREQRTESLRFLCVKSHVGISLNINFNAHNDAFI